MDSVPSNAPALNSALLKAAQDIIDSGHAPVPLWLSKTDNGDKLIPRKGWQEEAAKITKANVASYFMKLDYVSGEYVPAEGVGVILRDLVDIDLDDDDARLIWPEFAPETGCVWGSPARPAGHSLYAGKVQGRDFLLGGVKIIEIRSGDGRFATLPPSAYPKAPGAYAYADGKGLLPAAVDADKLSRAVRLTATTTAFKKLWPSKGSHSRHDFALCAAGGLAQLGLSDIELVQVIRLAAKSAGDSEIEDRIQAAKDTLKRFHANDPVKGWPSVAEMVGDKAVKDIRTFWQGAQNDLIDEVSFHALNDDGNAKAFVELFGKDRRFDHDRKMWLVWRGHRWCEDRKGETRETMRCVMSALHKRACAEATDAKDPKPRHYNGSCNTGRVDAALKAAADKPGIATSAQEYDANPWLLGVANGVLDLTTGKLRQGRREDMISKGLNISYDPSATCSRWDEFLDQIYGGNKEMIDFMWRWCGYCLTGSVEEELMLLLIGPGANGKSVYLKTLGHVLGDHTGTLPPNALDQRGSQRTSEYVAAVFGKRLVTLNEVGVNAKFNEMLVKTLVSRDLISGRLLYSNPVTFMPTHKLIFAMNNAPDVADSSHGFWRRVLVVPHKLQFIPGDDSLESKLKAEATGILTKMVSYCLEWQKRPLKLDIPSAIVEATADYKAGEDPLSDFFSQRCVIGAGQKVLRPVIWLAYGDWAAVNSVPSGERLSKKEFNQRLGKLFEDKKLHGNYYYLGIGLKTGFDNHSAHDAGVGALAASL